MGSWSIIYHYICTTPPPLSSLSYRHFLALILFRVIGDHSVSNLTFKGSLASTPLVLFVSSSPFVLQVPLVTTLVDN